MTDAKTTPRWTGSYAPGGYLCRCMSCNTTFMGNKRSASCFQCAVKDQEQTRPQNTDRLVADLGGKGSPHYVAGQEAARACAPWPQKPRPQNPIRDHLFWLGYKSVEDAGDAD